MNKNNKKKRGGCCAGKLDAQASTGADHSPPPPPPPLPPPSRPSVDVTAARRRLAISKLLQDRLAPAALAHTFTRRLEDLLGVVGGLVDGGLVGRAIVEGRRVAGLPIGSEREEAEAALYTPGWAGEEWMETGDAAGGFRQLVHFPEFRLGVAKSDRLAIGSVLSEVCRPPPGWRVRPTLTTTRMITPTEKWNATGSTANSYVALCRLRRQMS